MKNDKEIELLLNEIANKVNRGIKGEMYESLGEQRKSTPLIIYDKISAFVEDMGEAHAIEFLTDTIFYIRGEKGLSKNYENKYAKTPKAQIDDNIFNLITLYESIILVAEMILDTLQFVPEDENPEDETYLHSIIPEDILEKLEQGGFIKKEPLKWLKSKSLLAYFVDVANDKLNLKHGEKRSIKPFETMFNVSGLSGSINDYKKTGDLPIGYKVIDKMFS